MKVTVINGSGDGSAWFRANSLPTELERLVPQAIREGLESAADVAKDEHYPSYFRYSAPIANVFRAVSLRLAEHGYRPSEFQGMPVLKRDDGRIMISIQTGNKHTGDPTRTPSTAHPKRSAMSDAVSGNAKQRSFFDNTPTPEEGPLVFVLLVWRSGDKAQCEISLPVGMLNAKLSNWYSRCLWPLLLLGAISAEPEVGLHEGEFVDPAAEINKIVVPKKIEEESADSTHESSDSLPLDGQKGEDDDQFGAQPAIVG